jgi:hypothetical protein
MIPEYKLYHGAVLADIVDRFDGPVTFRESVDPGRLFNYVVNDLVGLQIKYATARLRPWRFSYPQAHIDQLRGLLAEYPHTFVVLVCRTDGFVCIPGAALLPFLLKAEGADAWLRVDRKKREMYRVFGPPGGFDFKFRTTSDPIVEALRAQEAGHLTQRDDVAVQSL